MPKTYEELLGLKKIEFDSPRAPIIGGKVDSARHIQPCSNLSEVKPAGNQSENSKPIIDFSYLTSNSSFQRAIMEFIKKFVPGFEKVSPRGSKEEMVKSFDSNAQNYGNVIKEFT